MSVVMDRRACILECRVRGAEMTGAIETEFRVLAGRVVASRALRTRPADSGACDSSS